MLTSWILDDEVEADFDAMAADELIYDQAIEDYYPGKFLANESIRLLFALSDLLSRF